MKRRVFRSISYIMICALSCITLSGCSFVPSLELSEEQGSLIVEYAAGKLLEYAKGHPGGLMSVEDIDRTDVNPGMQKPEEEQPPLPPLPSSQPPAQGDDQGAPAPEMPDQAEGEVPPDDGATSDQEAIVDTPEDVSETPTQSIAEALGIPGADITYDHYEVCATYPSDESELAFSMKAAPGKELLVVHFNLANPGSEDINAHTDSSGFKIRLMLNGSDKLRGDVTFLDNDLMNYDGLLTPGALVDAVLVFEIPQGEEVSSMDLLIVGDEGEDKYHLM